MLAESKGDKEAKGKNHQLTVVHQYTQGPEDWGSSSFVVEPTWGNTRHDNLEEALQQ
jgi:hypothetical protein